MQCADTGSAECVDAGESREHGMRSTQYGNGDGAEGSADGIADAVYIAAA